MHFQFRFFGIALVLLHFATESSILYPLPIYVVTIARHSHRIANLQRDLEPFAELLSLPPKLTTDWSADEPYAAADSKNFTPDVLRHFQLFPNWLGKIAIFCDGMCILILFVVVLFLRLIR
jgi:hypothetical protein